MFEVDHPASQQTKIAKVQEIFGSIPAHVVYVSIDLNTETLAKRLAVYGYDETLKTCFIWQGVTQYLTAEAVDETLSFIAQHSSVGSSVIFDYMYPTLLDGTIEHGEVSNMRSKQWVSGEMMKFGIPEGAIAEFLTQRGFTKIQNADHVRLHDLYFKGANAKRTVAYGYAVVSAVVK